MTVFFSFLTQSLLICWMFPKEYHFPGDTIDPHLVTFLKGSEDLILSVDVGTQSQHGAYQVIDMLAFLATDRVGEGCRGFML